MHEGGGNCLKYLKRGWNRTEQGGGDTKIKTKRGGKLGQGLGALKRGEGGWNLFTNYRTHFSEKMGERLVIWKRGQILQNSP